MQWTECVLPKFLTTNDAIRRWDLWEVTGVGPPERVKYHYKRNSESSLTVLLPYEEQGAVSSRQLGRGFFTMLAPDTGPPALRNLRNEPLLLLAHSVASAFL